MSWLGRDIFERKFADPDFLFSIELASFTNLLKKQDADRWLPAVRFFISLKTKTRDAQ